MILATLLCLAGHSGAAELVDSHRRLSNENNCLRRELKAATNAGATPAYCVGNAIMRAYEVDSCDALELMMEIEPMILEKVK